MEKFILKLLKEGVMSVSTTLVKHYKDIGLSDLEFILVIHIMNFKNEGFDFPTTEQLKERMTMDEPIILSMLQRLIKNGFLTVEDKMDKGVRSELIHIDPLYQKLTQYLMAAHAKDKATQEVKQRDNLYTIFEQEFGRPLSPIEAENLAMWQDNDYYSDDLIIAALREAVISGKLYFRYIDRILLEWQRNRIRTPQQAREFSLRFRKPPVSQPQQKTEAFPFYNWLEADSR
ncbi:DnaD domain-containing protein [Ammoniphilus resinae]|uniref:DNA replication protein n=1 Tax=Ammoniphilus resinae TaxID=861532 RepID=A0ABS4GSY6_9BACL|nr:DnaD domain-containing protein [Ammoniphilus resinae]MBP1933395.1 DNA replication protein [Ammoniphilus resinae]